MADRLAEMQAFLQAADAGSFAAAAARLGVSAQMVGKQVATIEQRLGARLLNRSTRRQSLTEAGHLYLNGCRRALAAIEAAVASHWSRPSAAARPRRSPSWPHFAIEVGSMNTEHCVRLLKGWSDRWLS